MEVSRNYSNNKIKEQSREYKDDDDNCAGLYCNSVGIHRLKIIYIEKTGLFCENCKTELEKCGLIVN